VIARIIDWVRSYTDDPNAGRATSEVYANPDTSESYILRQGILYPAALDAVMSRPNKSPALIGALLTGATAGWLSPRQSDDTLLALLGGPALRACDLHAITRTMYTAGRARHSVALLSALCGHKLADLGVLIEALWGADPGSIRDVAAITGDLRVTAFWWRHNGPARDQRAGFHGHPASVLSGDALVDTATRWETLTEGNPRLRSFILTGAFDFADENTLLAVGRAITDAPARTPAP